MTQIRPGRKLRNALRQAGRWLRRPQAIPEKLICGAGLMPTGHLRFPDFLCIGAQKAGTEWLYKNLQPHPEIFLDLKEAAQFFDANYHKSLRWYSRRFEPAGSRKAGEITPLYLALSRRRIRVVHRLMPEVRLLLVMRNPIERAWSQARMDLLSRDGLSYADVPERDFLAHFRSRSARRLGSYSEAIDRWTSFYPDEQLLTLFFDDIRERPQHLLRRVFAHLGVSDAIDWDSLPYAKKLHAGPAIDLPEHFRAVLEELYREEIDELSRRFGEPATSW